MQAQHLAVLAASQALSQLHMTSPNRTSGLIESGGLYARPRAANMALSLESKLMPLCLVFFLVKAPMLHCQADAGCGVAALQISSRLMAQSNCKPTSFISTLHLGTSTANLPHLAYRMSSMKGMQQPLRPGDHERLLDQPCKETQRFEACGCGSQLSLKRKALHM